jgi:hypothetical protein
MPVSQWAPDDELTSEHLNEMVDGINDILSGAGFDEGFSVSANDPTAYALTATNIDTTNGLALKVQYGPLLSPTEIATFAKARITFSQLLRLSGGSLDISQQSAPAVPGADLTRLYADTGGNSGLLHVIAGAGGSARRVLDGGIGTAAGDILRWTASNTPARLALGTARQNLAVNSGATDLAYQASLQSLMTAQGDIVQASSANTPARLAIGTARQQLNVNSGATAIEYVSSPHSLLTAQHDLLTASAANTPARLATGTANQVLHGANTWGSVATGDLATDATVTITSVSGSTSSPTTASGSAADLAQMTVTPTLAGGGYLLVVFEVTTENTTLGAATTYSLLVGGAGAKSRSHVAVANNHRDQLMILHIVSNPSAGATNFKVQWQVSAGTATAVGVERSLTVYEFKK